MNKELLDLFIDYMDIVNRTYRRMFGLNACKNFYVPSREQLIDLASMCNTHISKIKTSHDRFLFSTEYRGSNSTREAVRHGTWSTDYRRKRKWKIHEHAQLQRG